MVYAFDTNIVIHLMLGTQSVHDNRVDAMERGEQFAIPPFVNYEILRGLMIKPVPKHEKAYKIICSDCSIGEMDLAAWVRAAELYAELYAKRFTVKDSDILIAAYCMVNGYRLVTNNISDFENISGLDYVDWT